MYRNHAYLYFQAASMTNFGYIVSPAINEVFRYSWNVKSCFREREEDTSRDLGVCGSLEFVPSNLATFGIAIIMPSTLLSERWSWRVRLLDFVPSNENLLLQLALSCSLTLSLSTILRGGDLGVWLFELVVLPSTENLSIMLSAWTVFDCTKK